MTGCTTPSLRSGGVAITPILTGQQEVLSVDVLDRLGNPIVDGAAPTVRWTSDGPCVSLGVPTGLTVQYVGVSETSQCGGAVEVTARVFLDDPQQNPQHVSKPFDSVAYRIEVVDRPTAVADVTEVDDVFRVFVNGQLLGTAHTQQRQAFDVAPLLRAGSNELRWDVQNTSEGQGWTWGLDLFVDGSVIFSETCGYSPGTSCNGSFGLGVKLEGICTFSVPYQPGTAVCSRTYLP